ncbi:MAG: alpha/beta fold hydrolase [Rhizobiaceae bacterium]|nr:alpha/beta fold hydrolase [Rhizobiaceae bacterium]
MRRPKTQYAKCGDLNIAYQVLGDGPVDLLYAQGWLTNIEYAWESPDYARYLTKLSRFSRVIFFDKRGTGMSDRDVGVATLEERSEDIHAVLDAVGSTKAALFGVSEGGAICSVFAATYPERVSHLILNGSRPRYKWAPDFPNGMSPDEIKSELRKLVNNWGEPFPLTTGAPSVADDPAAAEWFAAYLRFAASPRAAEQITRMNYDIDYRDVLPAIHVPTLVVHREGDQWCPVEHAHYLAEKIPSAELRIIPGEDHLAWYGDQDRLVAEIKEFLTGEVAVASVERALLTVAFIDIVDSTDRLAIMGDERWKGLLEQLDFDVDRRIGSFGGQRVKHTGDGYLLSFSGPTSAIECVKAISADIERHGLSCKTGIHTGECERRGDDLSGMAVHIAARLMDRAEPGSIASSQTVKDLVIGSGLDFAPLGACKLKGVPGDWQLYSV